MRKMYTVFVMFKKSTRYTEEVINLLADKFHAKHIGCGTHLVTGVRDMQFEFEGRNGRKRAEEFAESVQSLKFVRKPRLVEEEYSFN